MIKTSTPSKQVWHKEFGKQYQPPQEIVVLIECDPHVCDESYGNDVAPHLAYYENGVPDVSANVVPDAVLWWDAADPKEREHNTQRYLVVVEPEGRNESFPTDDITDAVTMLQSWQSTATEGSIWMRSRTLRRIPGSQ